MSTYTASTDPPSPLRQVLRGFAIGSIIKTAEGGTLGEAIDWLYDRMHGFQRINAYDYLKYYHPSLQNVPPEELPWKVRQLSTLRGEAAEQETGIDPRHIQWTIHDLPESIAERYRQLLSKYPYWVGPLQPDAGGFTALYSDPRVTPRYMVPSVIYENRDYVNHSTLSGAPLDKEQKSQVVLGHELAHAQSIIPKPISKSLADMLRSGIHQPPELRTFSLRGLFGFGESATSSFPTEVQPLSKSILAGDNLDKYYRKNYRLNPAGILESVRNSIINYLMIPVEVTARTTMLQRVYDTLYGPREPGKFSSVKEMTDFYTSLMDRHLIVPESSTYVSPGGRHAALVADLFNHVRSSVAHSEQNKELYKRKEEVFSVPQGAWAMNDFGILTYLLSQRYGTILYDYIDAVLKYDHQRQKNIPVDDLRVLLENAFPGSDPATILRLMDKEFEDMRKKLAQSSGITSEKIPNRRTPEELQRELDALPPGELEEVKKTVLAVSLARRAAINLLRNILYLGFVGSSRLVQDRKQSDTLPA